MKTTTLISIKKGDVCMLQKCKHRWNNGTKVVIDSVYEKIDEYACHSIDPDNKQNFVVGINNLIKLK